MAIALYLCSLAMIVRESHQCELTEICFRVENVLSIVLINDKGREINFEKYNGKLSEFLMERESCSKKKT